MSVEFVVWGVLPMAIGVGAAVASLYCVFRRPSAFQAVATLVALVATAYAELMLYRITTGAWPTFIPHIVLALVLALVIVQLWRARRS